MLNERIETASVSVREGRCKCKLHQQRLFQQKPFRRYAAISVLDKMQKKEKKNAKKCKKMQENARKCKKMQNDQSPHHGTQRNKREDENNLKYLKNAEIESPLAVSPFLAGLCKRVCRLIVANLQLLFLLVC